MQVAEVTEQFNIDNVVPFFQPIMDLNHNAVSSYECLARLISFEQRAFLPSDFLHLIERKDLAAELTQTIFNRSANYFRHINTAWNVNVSLSDMSDVGIANFFKAQVSQYPNPQRISIEVTAANALHNKQVFEAFSTMCFELGMKVVIDHLSGQLDEIEYLLSFPISAMKLSAQLFVDAAHDTDLEHNLISYLALAKMKGILVIAEHVENQKMLSCLTKFNVSYAQGFYFSQPKAAV
jgi:EAL domain-containing protein (putative c-di-GMP-specific phosphodiesterase class I)